MVSGNGGCEKSYTINIALNSLRGQVLNEPIVLSIVNILSLCTFVDWDGISSVKVNDPEHEGQEGNGELFFSNKNN